jgi:hypothetical protein
VAAAFGVGQRGAAPAVHGPRVGADRQQVADHVEVAFRGGQVQRGTAIVVGGARFDPGRDQSADLVQVALTGRPGQRDHGLGLGLVLLPPRVTLAGPAAAGDQGIERVHVVLGDQLAAELDAPDRVAELVQPR